MRNKYIFSDWSAAMKLRNHINPHLKVDVEVVLAEESPEVATSAIVGYSVVVIDTYSKEILYKFYVECGKPDTYSLSTDQAVELLNIVGFNCEFKSTDFEVHPKIRDQIESLVRLGFTSIKRTLPRADIVVSSDPYQVKWLPLSVVSTFNYRDWLFLPANTPVLLEGLVKEDLGGHEGND